MVAHNRQRRSDLIAILLQQRGDGRPLYSYEYVSVLFGLSVVALRSFASYYRIERGHGRML